MFRWLLLLLALLSHATAATPTLGDDPVDVNPVSLAYQFEVVDWVVPGAEPLEIKRCYNSAGSGRRFCGWDFWPHAVYDFHQEGHKPDGFTCIVGRGDGDFPKYEWIELVEPNGRVCKYWRIASEAVQFTPPTKTSSVKTYCYAVREGDEDALSGYGNVRNNRLYIEADTHNMTVCESSGNVRYYKHTNHLYRLAFEQRPQGRRVHYGYDGDDRVTSVKTTNLAGTKEYASLKCKYKDNEMLITCSDGQKITYEFESFLWVIGDGSWFQKRYGLSKVSLQDTPLETYEYTHTIWEPARGALVASRKLADGREWQIEYAIDNDDFLDTYDARYKCVKRVLVPNPQKPGQWLALYTCEKLGAEVVTNASTGERRFDLTGTEIAHAAGGKTVLRIDAYGMVLAQEDASTKTVYSRDELRRLTQQALFDAHGELITRRSFTYDDAHNVVAEKAEANFSGEGLEPYDKRYEYSDAHLVTRIVEPQGVETRITYKPHTNLILTRTVLVNGRIHKRELFAYDNDHNLIDIVEDDGDMPTQRTYKRITPHPTLGLPEWVEEGYVDLATAKRLMLKKTHTTYNQTGKPALEEIYDCHGVLRYALSFEYDSFGHLVRKTDPLGRVFTYAYDEQGRLIEEREPGVAPKQYQYGWQGKLNWVRECAETPLMESYVYFPLQRKIVIQDSLGRHHELTFDAAGRTLCDSRTGAYAYDALGHLAREIQLDGTTTAYQNTIHGKHSHITYADGTTTTHRYALSGALAASTLEDGTRIALDNDALGRCLQKRIFSPQGAQLSDERWVYSAYHALSHTDPAGNTRTYAYDGAGRKSAETLAARITYGYDPLGFLERTQCGELTTTFTNDVLGRPVEERQAERHVRTTYDLAGNCTRVERLTAAGWAVDVTTYDLRRRPLKHVDPLGRTETYCYTDGPEPEIRHTDLTGIVTEQRYDAEGLLREQSSSTGRHEHFEYDALRRKVRHTTNDFCVAWEYDAMGRVAALKETSGQLEKLTRYAYDARGRLVETTKPSGKKLFKSYDALSRLMRLSASDGTVDYAYAYGALDQPTHVQDLVYGLEIRRSYTPLGELVREETPVGTVRKDYDAWGRCLRLTLPDGSSVEYTHAPTHLAAVRRQSAAGHTLYAHEALAWDTDGTTLRAAMIGGLGELKRRQDVAQRPEAVSSPYFTQQVERLDNAKRPVAMRSNLFGLSEWTYDASGQLASEQGVATHVYSYDPLENRVSQDQMPWDVDGLNRLCATQGEHCEYDADGQLIAWQSASEAWALRYDALGRLTKARRSDGLTIRSTYDAWHRRLVKQIASDKQLFFYDGERELGACRAPGRIEQLRVMNMDPRPQAVAIELEGRVFAPLHDLCGNMAALVALDTRSLVATYNHSAFGECKVSGSVRSPWRFAGQRVDDETSLSLFGKRYYQPRWGRWITPDPEDFVDGANLYAYVHNDPVGRYDPDGTQGYEYGWWVQIGSQYGHVTFGSGDLVATALRGAFYATGATLRWAVRHTVFIPVIKEALMCLGDLLCLEASHFQIKSHIAMFLDSYKKPTHGLLNCHLMGIGNDEKDAREAQQAMQEFTNSKAFVIWIPTRGFLGDLLEAVLIRLGCVTENVRRVQAQLEYILRERLGEGNRLALTAHSKGCLIAATVLKRLSEEDCSHIAEVSLYATPKLVSSFPDAEVRNCVDQNDLVTRLDPLGWLKHFLGIEKYNVVRSHSPYRLFEHEFLGGSYWHDFRRQHIQYLHSLASQPAH